MTGFVPTCISTPTTQVARRKPGSTAGPPCRTRSVMCCCVMGSCDRCGTRPGARSMSDAPSTSCRHTPAVPCSIVTAAACARDVTPPPTSKSITSSTGPKVAAPTPGISAVCARAITTPCTRRVHHHRQPQHPRRSGSSRPVRTIDSPGCKTQPAEGGPPPAPPPANTPTQPANASTPDGSNSPKHPCRHASLRVLGVAN